MKAEHRKELQTNALADRVGKLVDRMKHRPKRRTLLYVVAGVLVLLVLLVVVQIRRANARAAADRWVLLEDGARPFIDLLQKEYPETPAGRAARFQTAWLHAWDQGIRFLGGGDPMGAVINLHIAQERYKALAEECKDDPVWGPEAHYNLALVTEALAAQDIQKLEEARDLYAKVANDYRESPQGKLAEDRVKALEKDSQTYREAERFYRDFKTTFRIPSETEMMEFVHKARDSKAKQQP